MQPATSSLLLNINQLRLASKMLDSWQVTTKRVNAMKRTIREKMIYIGAGAGLVCFALYGLLPGSFAGGLVGLGIAGKMMGTPVAAGIAARMLLAIFMLLGILVSGLLFVGAGSVVGWVLGLAADQVQTVRIGMKTHQPGVK